MVCILQYLAESQYFTNFQFPGMRPNLQRRFPTLNYLLGRGHVSQQFTQNMNVYMHIRVYVNHEYMLCTNKPDSCYVKVIGFLRLRGLYSNSRTQLTC